MEPMIRFYNQDGTLKREIPFNSDNIEQTSGMLIKCYLLTGKEVVGYSKPDEYITMLDDLNLWIWKNIDEDNHKLIDNEQDTISIKMKDITRIDAILYSNHRWSNKITNKFYIDIK